MVSGITTPANPQTSLSVDLSPVSAGLWKLPMSHRPRGSRDDRARTPSIGVVPHAIDSG